ncbi:MAG: energy transducer TonB [Longimicrobiaceae bacterium]
MRLSSRTAVLACAMVAAALAPGALAAQADSTACAPGDRLADGRTVAAAADSLFRLAHERQRDGDYVLVPFTRKGRQLSSTSRPPTGELDRSLLNRLMQGGGLTTLLAYQLDREGKPVRVEVVRSSGEPRFDRIALDQYQSAQYHPARSGACTVPYFEVAPYSARARVERRGGE